MNHGRGDKNTRYTPQWASQRLLLGCFFVLLFGSIEKFHEPLFVSLQHANESIQSPSAKYSLAQLPAKLRIRNDALKRQTDGELLKAFDLPTDDEVLLSLFTPLWSSTVYNLKFDCATFHHESSNHSLLPPTRAPPNHAIS